MPSLVNPFLYLMHWTGMEVLFRNTGVTQAQRSHVACTTFVVYSYFQYAGGVSSLDRCGNWLELCPLGLHHSKEKRRNVLWCASSSVLLTQSWNSSVLVWIIIRIQIAFLLLLKIALLSQPNSESLASRYSIHRYTLLYYSILLILSLNASIRGSAEQGTFTRAL